MEEQRIAIMNKLIRDVKNFGELYELIGEKCFDRIAYILVIVLMLAPFPAGIVNYFMLKDSYNYITPYDAYVYNYKCMTIWNIVFSIMFFWVAIYIIGKISFNKWGLKRSFKELKTYQSWLIWWLVLLVWSIIPVVFSIDPIGALFGVSQLASGYISYYFMLSVMLCTCMIRNKKHRENIVWIFILVTDVLSLAMLSFEYDIPVLKAISAAPGVSVYTNSNHYGYMITMSAIAITGLFYYLLIQENNKHRKCGIVFCLASLILQSFAIIVNDTLGSYFAILFSFIIMPVIWWGKTKRINAVYLIPLLILLLLTVISYFGVIPTKLGSTIGQSLIVFMEDLFKIKHKSDGYRKAGTNRMGLWIDTIKKIKERPIVGYGPDITVDRNNNYILTNTPHNEFLECAFYLGIPGLIMYLGGLFSLCGKKMKELKDLSWYSMIAAGVIVAYLISSFFGVRKFNTVCYFYMFLGLLIGSELRDENKNDT